MPRLIATVAKNQALRNQRIFNLVEKYGVKDLKTGDPIDWFHGSTNRFNSFSSRKSFRPDQYGFAGPGIYGTTNRSTAELFARSENHGHVSKFWALAKNPVTSDPRYPGRLMGVEEAERTRLARLLTLTEHLSSRSKKAKDPGDQYNAMARALKHRKAFNKGINPDLSDVVAETSVGLQSETIDPDHSGPTNYTRNPTAWFQEVYNRLPEEARARLLRSVPPDAMIYPGMKIIPSRGIPGEAHITVPKASRTIMVPQGLTYTAFKSMKR